MLEVVESAKSERVSALRGTWAGAEERKGAEVGSRTLVISVLWTARQPFRWHNRGSDVIHDTYGAAWYKISAVRGPLRPSISN